MGLYFSGHREALDVGTHQQYWARTAILLAVAASLTGCDAAPSKAPRTSPPAVAGSGNALRFGACGDRVDADDAQLPLERAQRLTFECGVLDVSLDHDNPSGDRIAMAVVRVRDANQHDRLGSLVMNPGGPVTRGSRGRRTGRAGFLTRSSSA